MITCGGGFSSSGLVNHLKEQAKEKHLDDKVNFVFRPFDFGGLGDKVYDVDLVMLCPHLRFQAKQLVEEYPNTPFYMIPTRLYGLIDAEEFYEDAIDAIAGFKETGRNPFYFDGEENPVTNYRTVSHRKWLAQNKK